jgi:phosphoserine phosphatase
MTTGKNNERKKKITLVDFDGTLIRIDSLLYIFKCEKYYLNFNFILLAIRIFLFKYLKNYDKEIRARSIFKRQLLIRYKNNIPQSRITKYTNYFHQLLNTNLLDILSESNETTIIISASETKLIKSVIGTKIKNYIIIANKLNNKFNTCYGKNKLIYLKKYLGGDLRKYSFTLYTDSFSDKPLMEICDKVYIVKNCKINKIK